MLKVQSSIITARPLHDQKVQSSSLAQDEQQMRQGAEKKKMGIS